MQARSYPGLQVRVLRAGRSDPVARLAFERHRRCNHACQKRPPGTRRSDSVGPRDSLVVQLDELQQIQRLIAMHSEQASQPRAWMDVPDCASYRLVGLPTQHCAHPHLRIDMVETALAYNQSQHPFEEPARPNHELVRHGLQSWPVQQRPVDALHILGDLCPTHGVRTSDRLRCPPAELTEQTPPGVPGLLAQLRDGDGFGFRPHVQDRPRTYCLARTCLWTIGQNIPVDTEGHAPPHSLAPVLSSARRPCECRDPPYGRGGWRVRLQFGSGDQGIEIRDEAPQPRILGEHHAIPR